MSLSAAGAASRAAAPSAGGCDLSKPWRLGPQVAVRPEPFGALVYDFDSRRLSFLKSRTLRDVVESLERHDSALAACHAAGVGDDQLSAYTAALARLVETGLLIPGEEDVA
jgi:putative mycofactocin binding protein MftB